MLGAVSGFPVTEAWFLAALEKRWFGCFSAGRGTPPTEWEAANDTSLGAP